jgi:hypothetical protein
VTGMGEFPDPCLNKGSMRIFGTLGASIPCMYNYLASQQHSIRTLVLDPIIGNNEKCRFLSGEKVKPHSFFVGHIIQHGRWWCREASRALVGMHRPRRYRLDHDKKAGGPCLPRAE